jgi:diacylglycerol kinase (ATP)
VNPASSSTRSPVCQDWELDVAGGNRIGTAARPTPTIPGFARRTPLAGDTGLVAFVANPTKRGSGCLHTAAIRACDARRLPEPLWFETTAEDPGVGQARRAIELGATVVVAVGGDGTARAVARALTGTAVPMGLIPLGTGNLLARNLGLPLGDADHVLRIALAGRERAIDVGWLRVEHDLEPRDHLFLVMAGLGLDAALMAGADASLKARFGWGAYFIAGARQWNARRLHVDVDVDGGPVISQCVRTILIGNCGLLPGGITLLPRALPDDGWLDVGALGTRGGLLGWAQLIGRVVLQSAGAASRGPARIESIDHLRARKVHVRADNSEAVQADGDVLGFAREVTAHIEPAALIVRVD